jgi:hypothetical protein
MASVQGGLGQQLRDALIPMLTEIHLVEDRIAETMAEIGIHYRRSSNVSGKAGHTLHAGDRAPDCEFQGQAGLEPLRLFDLFREPVYHLLLFAGEDAEVASKFKVLRDEIRQDFKGLIKALVVIRTARTDFYDGLFDSDGGAHALYEAEPSAIVLIRPDGYIGFRGGARHTEALREYLAGILTG